MGRKKKVDAEATTTPGSAQNGSPAVKTKADAFRAAVAQGIESPKAISEFVMTTYGMEMSPGMVSAYKSMEKNKGKKTKRKYTKAAKPATATPTKTATVASSADNDMLSTLEAIKDFVKAHGAEQVKRMVDLFA
jgi:hypothetical protein